MTEPTSSSSRAIGQLLRFGIVGIINTSIDLLITNFLVILTGLSSTPGLLGISLIASSIATVNSYFLNKLWTFQAKGEHLPHYPFARFFAMAMISITVNTSVFLFTYRMITLHSMMPSLLAVNISKLTGVLVASIVGFIGYRVHVFHTPNLTHFRDIFRFDTTSSHMNIGRQISLIFGLALLARLAYLTLTTAIIGDAVHYSEIAAQIAQGQFTAIDSFWSSLYSYWGALFTLMGFGRFASAVLSSLVPGTLLMIPIVLIARHWYGEKVAWITGVLCALHPRFIEYSCNGYAEMFYILAYASGIAFLTFSIPRIYATTLLLLGGTAFGIFFCVRNEAIVAFGLCLIGLMLTSICSHHFPNNNYVWIRQPIKAAFLTLVSFTLLVGAYVMLSEQTIGSPGLLQKSTNLTKHIYEQFDPYGAAKETYQKHSTPNQELTSSAIMTLFERIPANITYTLERLPGVLITPIWLFAFLLPRFATRKQRVPGEEWPLITMLLFPLLFYPLIQVQSRNLFPILIPLNIFGAAGLIAFSTFVSRKIGFTRMTFYTVILCLLISIGVTMAIGYNAESNYRYNRDLAGWIQHNVPKGEILVGGGYGYVSNTAFLANTHGEPHLWTKNPADLVSDVKDKKGHWLIIYEAYLKESNPELLPVLTNGLQGMQLRFETKDNHGQRIQIYSLDTP